MSARYRRESDDGHYNEHSTPRRRVSPPEVGSSDFIDGPPSLDELTDSMDLGKGQQEIWDEIYRLGISGVDKYIELPQIVVVGDQSSGKSSVLEAITGVNFPRNSGMCTKFPTQINLRKAAKSSFSVSLDPSLDATEADKARLAKFPDNMRGETDLGIIVKRAEQTIWPHGQSGNSASKDTLRLDFSGPRKDYLTLVDLPGIIHTNASNVMGTEEVVAIRELAIDYMKNPRSIILAVISAANDLNLQQVASLTKSIDPTGSRTLGVITKPDRIDSTESEEMFIKLAKNEIINFDLGWHVLRNRSNSKEEKNCSQKERDFNEKRFFETSNFNVLDQSNLGIDSLKAKMSSLLLQRFAEVIPHVVLQIEQRLNNCKKSLEDLGEGYGDVSQMRSKMQDWCKTSTDYVSKAATANYRDHAKPSFFASDINEARIRKLRSRIDAENVRFERELSTMGHSVEIIDIHPPLRRKSRADGVKYPDRMSRAEFMDRKVEPVIFESAGQELRGDSNPLLVYQMFQTQSENWDAIALRHMTNIASICELFIREVLDFVWPKPIQEKVWSALVEDQLEIRQDGASGEVKKLCKDRCTYAKSYDMDYTVRMRTWEQKFMEVGGKTDPVTLRPLTQAEVYLARLLAYYEVTSKTFMSNVIVQVIERHLIDGLEEIFDTTRIHGMDSDKIEKIFEEDENVREQRARLQAERSTLEGGLKSAKRLAARKDLKVYDKTESGPEAMDIDALKNTSNGSMRRSTTAVAPDAAPAHPSLPSRPSPRPETPRADPDPVTPRRGNSTRSNNPFAYPSSQEGPYFDSPQSPSRPQESSAPAQRPPPVPPYVPQNSRNDTPGGYGNTVVPDLNNDRRSPYVGTHRRERV